MPSDPISLGIQTVGFLSSGSSKKKQAEAAKAAMAEIDKALTRYPEMKDMAKEMFAEKTNILGNIKDFEEGAAMESIQRNFYDVSESARMSQSQSGFESSGQVEELMDRQGLYMERDAYNKQQQIGIQYEENLLGAEQEKQDRLANIETAIANLNIQKAQLNVTAKDDGGLIGKFGSAVGL